MRKAVTALVFLVVGHAIAQTSTAPIEGVRDRSPTLVALTNAKIVVEAGKSPQPGVLLIDEGIIRSVADQEVPAGARQIDLSGHIIYPGLIEPYSEIATTPQRGPTAHWNKHVHPEWSTANDSKGNQNGKANESLRKAGFTIGLLVSKNGVLKGWSTAVSLGNARSADSIVSRRVAQHVRLTAPRSRDYYPGSPMGAVALARQTFYDVSWYEQAWRAFRTNADVPRPEMNASLEALSDAIANDTLFIFDAIDEQYAIRADQFAVEFGLNRIALRGSGREYQRLTAITAPAHTIIVPLNFPKPPNVATPESTRDASLSELMHWRLAPENPARLRAAGANIVFTSHGLEKKGDFRKQIRKAVERGLSEHDALFACTLGPARLLGIENKAGSLAVGKAANLMICDGKWLGNKTKITETWVDGERFAVDHESVDDFSGIWDLKLESSDESRKSLYLEIEKDGQKKLKGEASSELPTLEPAADAEDAGGTDDDVEEEDHGHEHNDEEHEEANEEEHGEEEDGPNTETSLKRLVAQFGRLSASFSSEIWGARNTVRISATLVGEPGSQKLIGELIDENGKRIRFQGRRIDPTGASHEDDDKPDDDSHDSNEEQAAPTADEESDSPQFVVTYPLGAYGVTDTNREVPSVLFEGATVWTCGPAGTLENASVLIENGKVAAVGRDVVVPSGVRRIDARGKHITPGIIDCHSHMATDGGVNESTQAITAEVRVGDFIDATDITIYRQLAGGITTANILHGSANPIGGQNQVMKLRWGKLPEEMKFAEAPGGIKFALGENVKQSNWGDEYRSRYPQSRLGVEQIMRDAFIAAKEYESRWKAWKATGRGLPPRRDLELDAILQIVNGQRWIHCHSYRQDEILALIRTLDDFGITIGTFQHILEGYKVTKEMAEHGAMGSSFSDWWAYKFEVFDAIPYNGVLMHDAGIVVSFNSDDAELARHLNHEAAKAIKYGGLAREEALKFVTLNPAKQLRIDQYVGSLETGKHADLVVWSGDPLQVISRCEQTWIDGSRYFDIEEEKRVRKTQAETREQLIRLILDSGESMKDPGEKDKLWRDLFPRHDEYCGHGHGH